MDPGTGAGPGTGADATRSHIRGSALLLVGRIISLSLNFASQVVIVRYLSKHDYGAFAFGLSMVMTGSGLALVGMKDVASRFMSIYWQEQDYGRMFGTLAVMAATVGGLSTAVAVAAAGCGQLFADAMDIEPLSLALLMALIVLVPVEAFDQLLVSLFAVFAGARGVFLRRHLLGPLLKLSAILAVVLWGGDVHAMAISYVIAGVVGILLYLMLLAHVLHSQQLWTKLNLGTLRFPVREIFSFSTPLLASELFLLLRGSLVVFLLELYHGTSSVAAYRAVIPVAMLTRLVVQNFRFLFLPNAARLYAKGEYEQIDRLYWQTAAWIAVFTFPLFGVCFALAEPTTVLLFGEQYEESAAILSLLALGYYVHAAFGFNQHTMKVFGKSWCILATDLMSVVTILGLNLLLVPRFGAVGGAVGTCLTLVAHNVFNQVGLAFGTPVKPFRRRYAPLYGGIAAGAAFVFAVQYTWQPPVAAGVALIAVVWLGILAGAREQLQIHETFPEFARLPLIRRVAPQNG